jgi:CHAD domain-containing protein
MTRFALDTDLDPDAGLRRVGIAEFERAQAALSLGTATGVHEMRKSCKRLRALARLLRDLGPALAGPATDLNARLRAAAQALSPLREARVAADIFGRLACPPAVDTAAWARLGATLEQEAAAEPQGLRLRALAATELRQAQDQFENLPLDGVHARQLRRALRRSIRRCERSYRLARRQPRAEHLHDWRKQIKRLGYQLDLLDRRAPTLPGGKRLKGLGEKLGEHHDLHALEQCLQQDPDRYGGELLLWRLHDMLRPRSERLQQQVLALGAKLYG